MTAKRLLVLPRYTTKGPSSRVRIFQYLPQIQDEGYKIDVQPFFDDSYIDALFAGQRKNIGNILASYFKRIKKILEADLYDLIWVQYELLPWLPQWVGGLLLSKQIKLIVDYDDAIFHRYDQHVSLLIRLLLGKKIYKIMRSADGIVVGNKYLADHARQAGAKLVKILPSVVDFSQYSLKVHKKQKQGPVLIGWIGSPQTVKHLQMIRDVIQSLASENMKFVVIGAKTPEELSRLPIETWEWSLDREAELIRNLDVGIMPLTDTPFERGKCGYKLIQYMACGLPVVASPVGINSKIVRHGENGFLADKEEDWISALKLLQKEPIKRKNMGMKGRELVQKKYSLQSAAQETIKFLKET